MYQYDDIDETIVRERAQEFRGQVKRRLAGELSEEEFKPLRLMNGVYLQLHAYMLRVAIPYGVLSATQMRQLAHIARKYDKGYGHFTTRQNIQFNWPKLVDLPDILDELAHTGLHAIQTSGNCIRNTTTDPFAGAAADEREDPRPWAEIIRQWSTLHPEFTYLPRKFKIAITGATQDRAAILAHDIGLRVDRDANNQTVFDVYAGGGLGRTPRIGIVVRKALPAKHLLAYLTAILRAYNLQGRRDNKYKARIKILVEALGEKTFRDLVEEEYADLENGALTLPPAEISRIRGFFPPPPKTSATPIIPCKKSPEFRQWLLRNTRATKVASLSSVVVSLKPIGGTPGDATAEQMQVLASIAEDYGFDELRVTSEQNIVLPFVEKPNLPEVFARLETVGLATPNAGLATDIVACPGLDYCDLANARSIPVAQAISQHIDRLGIADQAGEVSVKISGCINACARHHIANIGILGVDKRGEETYQVTIGGRDDEKAGIGKIIGPSLPATQIPRAVGRLLTAYLENKAQGEAFADTVSRLGIDPFKGAVYAD